MARAGSLHQCSAPLDVQPNREYPLRSALSRETFEAETAQDAAAAASTFAHGLFSRASSHMNSSARSSEGMGQPAPASPVVARLEVQLIRRLDRLGSRCSVM